MSLQLHNTLTKKTELFSPINDQKVTLYTCGPTVYHSLTIGNWTAYIYWDTLVRTLIHSGYTVERVMNITDVGHLVSDEDEGEDKMQKGARREGKTAWQVAQYYTEDFLQGMRSLNLLPPEHITKATDYIDQQLALIRTLKDKGYTYQIDDGIYFDTAKFPSYTNFARLDLEAQQAGARVSFNNQKRQASDFALWKFSPVNEKRDMEWETPLDLLEDTSEKRGFPGWHIECSAMALSVLGDTIDIHTGGIDHIPVHHTNEIAQSEAATGKRFARTWLHNNHLKVNGTKISKSLNNGYTLEDLKKKGFSAQDFRLFVLQSHYRSESNFTWENLTAAKNRLHHWKNIAEQRWQINKQGSNELAIYLPRLQAAVQDDLNIPEALKIIDEAFKNLATTSTQSLHAFLEQLDTLLGLELLSATPDIDIETKDIILQREKARNQKDWKTSDQLRDQLAARGIILNDHNGTTIWQRS